MPDASVVSGRTRGDLRRLCDGAQGLPRRIPLLPEPVQASPDGLTLQPWKGAALTVGGELDKLASNIILGRNFAGLHWRSDARAGLLWGEEVAIRALEEVSVTGNELFSGWSLKRFDGRRVTVG